MNSSNSIFTFQQSTKDAVLSYVSLREGEVKLGEKVSVYADLDSFDGKYVVLGVKEDVGPRANLGLSGSDAGYACFLKRFLNMQSNSFLTGEEVLMLGEVCVDSVVDELDVLRSGVEELDDLLVSLLMPIYEKGLFPILIGGGHNNAYALIKACSMVQNKAMDVVNCDPHADFRALEGRHSGNSFSYAKKEGWLANYAVLGLHQQYNSQSMLDRLVEEECYVTFFEEYLTDQRDFLADVDDVLRQVKDTVLGVELDMDAIINMPSSAFTPSGFTLEEARRYLIKCAKSKKAAYLHLPEAAPKNEREEAVVGKALAYLVSDFIKS
jgi:formiminoglutamase